MPKDVSSSIFKVWTVALPRVWDYNQVFLLNVTEIFLLINADSMKFARGIKMDRSSLVKSNSAYFGEAGEFVLKLWPIGLTINPYLRLLYYGHSNRKCVSFSICFLRGQQGQSRSCLLIFLCLPFSIFSSWSLSLNFVRITLLFIMYKYFLVWFCF